MTTPPPPPNPFPGHDLLLPLTPTSFNSPYFATVTFEKTIQNSANLEVPEFLPPLYIDQNNIVYNLNYKKFHSRPIKVGAVRLQQNVQLINGPQVVCDCHIHFDNNATGFNSEAIAFRLTNALSSTAREIRFALRNFYGADSAIPNGGFHLPVYLFVGNFNATEWSGTISFRVPVKLDPALPPIQRLDIPEPPPSENEATSLLR